MHYLQLLLEHLQVNASFGNKNKMLARSELNSIESKISEALINNEISHEDFITITNEKK